MKQKIYWLRGIVVAVFILGIYQLIVWLVGEKCVSIGDICYDTYNIWLTPISNFLYNIDIFYYFVVPFFEPAKGWEFLVHVFTIWPSLIFWGALLGYLYGKIKNRNRIV